MAIKCNPILTISVIISLFIGFVGCLEKSKNTESKNGFIDSIVPFEDKNNALSVPQNLSHFPQTEFLPTLENPVSIQKNNIYSACLLLGWDAYVSTLQDSIQLLKDNSQDFHRINQSKS